jgi:hypothetical protein
MAPTVHTDSRGNPGNGQRGKGEALMPTIPNEVRVRSILAAGCEIHGKDRSLTAKEAPGRCVAALSSQPSRPGGQGNGTLGG